VFFLSLTYCTKLQSEEDECRPFVYFILRQHSCCVWASRRLFINTFHIEFGNDTIGVRNKTSVSVGFLIEYSLHWFCINTTVLTHNKTNSTFATPTIYPEKDIFNFV
jgi:hypothetical protein